MHLLVKTGSGRSRCISSSVKLRDRDTGQHAARRECWGYEGERGSVNSGVRPGLGEGVGECEDEEGDGDGGDGGGGDGERDGEAEGDR